MLRFLTVCLIFGLIAAQPDFGMLSKAKPSDSNVQKIANDIKAKVEAKNGPGSLSLNKVIQFKTRFVDMPRPGGGLTGGIVYYIKIEASTGKFIQVDVLVGDGRKEVNTVKATTKSAEIEGF